MQIGINPRAPLPPSGHIFLKQQVDQSPSWGVSGRWEDSVPNLLSRAGVPPSTPQKYSFWRRCYNFCLPWFLPPMFFTSHGFCLPWFSHPMVSGSHAFYIPWFLPPMLFTSHGFCLPCFLHPMVSASHAFYIPWSLPPMVFTSRGFCLPWFLSVTLWYRDMAYMPQLSSWYNI